MTRLADQLRLLLPPVSYNGSAPILSAAIEAEANALAQADGSARTVHETSFPDSGSGLDDWERLLGLPDPCLADIPQSHAQRVQAVLSKLQSQGGQSKAFFIRLARSLGFNITITTFRPAPAGHVSAGDPINGGDWAFTWRINAPAVTVNYTCAGISAAGDPLASWGNKSLECRLSQMKPAESILLFGYGDH